MNTDTELAEIYDDADMAEGSLLEIRDKISSLEYSEDRSSAEDYLNDAIEALQKAMRIMDKDRWISER